MHNPAIRALLPQINLTIDPEVDAVFPARRAAHVSITTSSGQKFSYYQPTRKGDPDLPLSDNELEEKFLELTTPVLGTKLTAKLLNKLWKLDKVQLADGLANAINFETP